MFLSLYVGQPVRYTTTIWIFQKRFKFFLIKMWFKFPLNVFHCSLKFSHLRPEKCEPQHQSTFMKENFWPKSVVYRRFRGRLSGTHVASNVNNVCLSIRCLCMDPCNLNSALLYIDLICKRLSRGSFLVLYFKFEYIRMHLCGYVILEYGHTSFIPTASQRQNSCWAAVWMLSAQLHVDFMLTRRDWWLAERQESAVVMQSQCTLRAIVPRFLCYFSVARGNFETNNEFIARLWKALKILQNKITVGRNSHRKCVILSASAFIISPRSMTTCDRRKRHKSTRY